MARDMARTPSTRETNSGATSRFEWAPWIAFVFVAGSIAIVPYGMPISMGYTAPLAAVGIVAILLARVDPLKRWGSVTIWPPLVVLAAYGLSIAFSQYSDLALRRSLSMCLFAMVFVVVQVAGWDRRALRGVLWISVAAVVVIAADIFMQRISGSPLFAAASEVRSGRLSGSQGNPNDLAAASILLPLGLAALPRRRFMAWYALLACVGAIPWVLSASRQALVGWLVAISIPMKSRVSRRTMLVVLGLVCIAVVAMFVLVPTLRERAVTTWNHGLGIRESIAAFGCSLVLQNPLVGIGPGVFGEYYIQAALEGWSWRGTPLKQVGMPWVHSLPLEVLVELGVVGAIAMGTVLVCGFRQVRRGFKGDASNSRLAMAVLAALLAGLIMGLVDLSFIKDWVRCLFWLVLGLAYVAGKQPRGTNEPPIG